MTFQHLATRTTSTDHATGGSSGILLLCRFVGPEIALEATNDFMSALECASHFCSSGGAVDAPLVSPRLTRRPPPLLLLRHLDPIQLLSPRSDYLADLEARHAQGSRSGQEVDGSGSDDGESAWEAADKLNRRSARLSGALARSVLHEGDGGR